MVKEDQTYEYQANGTSNGRGAWKVTGDNTLVTEDASGEIINYQIVKLNDHTLITKHEIQAETPKGDIKATVTLTYVK